MGLFERYLSLWVALSIGAGLAFGSLFPALFAGLAAMEYASVNLVVAVLIRAMVYPMMVAVDLGSLKSVGQRPTGLIITVVINWLIKPFYRCSVGDVWGKRCSGAFPFPSHISLKGIDA